MMSILSVIVVNWNRCEQAAACIESIMRSDVGGNTEIVLVDNGSVDGSEAAIRGRYPDVKFVQVGWNSGFAEGVNIGVAHATAPWVALINNDATVARDWVSATLAAIAAADDRIGMLQCHMIFKDGTGAVNSTGLQIYADGTGGDRGFGDPAGSRGYAADLFCPSGGAAVYRRSMLDQVQLDSGILDRRFFMYAEDADLGWRCRLYGWHARYVSTAVVEHMFQGSANSHGSNFVALQCRRNRIMTITKNGSVRFIVDSVHVSVADLLWIVVKCGPRELTRTVSMVLRSVEDRRVLGRRAVVPRRQLEATWFTAPPKGHRRTLWEYARQRVVQGLQRKAA